jgi:ABC-type glycerol-3-phosphate transport system substrate-binding protein
MNNRPRELTRRHVLQLGMGLAGALAVSGCAAGGVGGAPADAPAVGGDVEAFLRDTGAALGIQNVSLLAYSAPQAEAIRALTGQFTDLTGITVDWTSLDEQSAANKAAVALGSGSGGYDVVHTTSGLIPTYVERSWLASMSDLRTSSPAAMPAWEPGAYGKGTTDLLSVDGALYAAPSFLGTQLFYYRTDVFAAKGITEPPRTLAELRDVCAQIHDETTAAIALRSAPSASQLLFVWSAWLYAFGGSYYSTYENGNYSGVSLASDAAVAALDLYSQLLRDYAPTGATNWSVEDVTRAFTAGQVAIVQEGAVFGGTYDDPAASQAAGKVGTFVIPGGPGGQYVPFNAHGWGVAQNSAKKDAAWLFVQWATLQSTLTAATTGDTAFSTPPLAAVYQSPEYQERYGFDDFVPSVTATIDLANNGGLSPLTGDPNYLPATPDWNTTGQRISEELSKAVTGQISAEAAIAAAAAAMGTA